ncbi:MAG: hypothetical protein AAGF02_12750 [Actinomycetota bacterium]
MKSEIDALGLHALALVETGHYEASLILHELLLAESTKPRHKAALANNVAYLLALLGRDLERAERLVRHAEATGTFRRGIGSTLGAVLVQRADVEEGSRLLLEALDAGESHRERAETLGLLAHGAERLGDDERASHYRDEIITLETGFARPLSLWQPDHQAGK